MTQANVDITSRRVILSTRDLGVSIDGRAVLDSVTLDIGEGEIVAVAGPNGAGKSTLLRALAGTGAGSGAVRAGTVTLDGVGLFDMDQRARGRTVAYLPQERTVHWPLSVERVVALGRLPHGGAGGRASDADRAAIERAMTAMDVVAIRERPVSQLSGGERARVLLARALAQEARVLVADEPTAGLDPAHALQVFAHMTRLAAEGRSIVVALHDLTLAARFCHRLVLLKGGRIHALGPTASVLDPATLAAVYGIRAEVREIGGHPVVVALQALT